MYRSINKHKISERTGKNTVAIVGTAPSTRHLYPRDDINTEVWSMNESYHFGHITRWDRWFQIHPETIFSGEFTTSDPNHLNWLMNNDGRPMYMQRHFDTIPGSIEFPLEEVVGVLRKRYIKSSVACMVGLAILEEFERIEIYGIDMDNDTEYGQQRPNFEYACGVAEGKGIEIFVPDGCKLFSGGIYGYEYQAYGIQQQFEIMRDELIPLREKVKDDLSRLDAIKMYKQGKLDLPDIDKAIMDTAKTLAFLDGKYDALKSAVEIFSNLKFNG